MWVTSGGRSGRSSQNSVQFSDLSDSDSIDEDSVDPRVQEELERLNNATDAINKLEVELDESRAAFRQLLSDSSYRINSLAKKLGSCVEKARPYYEARMKAKEVHAETQKAALRFERANSALSVAKEMVFLAEEGLQKEGRTFDPAWQEMLNHATMRVNEVERERTLSEQEHKNTSRAYNEADTTVKDLEKELKKNIIKSRPYFEMKAQFNKMLEQQKRQVQELEESVLRAKASYADALHNLEEISDEIHQRRKLKEERQALGIRGHGVGAESPEQPNRLTSEIANHVNKETALDEDYLKLPSKLKLLKSSSSSTLAQNASLGEEKPTQSSRLRKSQSVIDRTEASPLFGRYSISRHNKLQVDHSSQTDEELLKTTTVALASYRLSMPSDSLLEDVKSETLKLPLRSEKVDSTSNGAVSSSSKSSIQSSETSSPTNSNAAHSTTEHLPLPATMSLSALSSEDGGVSETESLASTESFTDDQIASLMIEKELEAVAQNLNFKIRLHDDSNNSSHSLHQMTQTVLQEPSGKVVLDVSALPEQQCKDSANMSPNNN